MKTTRIVFEERLYDTTELVVVPIIGWQLWGLGPPSAVLCALGSYLTDPQLWSLGTDRASVLRPYAERLLGTGVDAEREIARAFAVADEARIIACDFYEAIQLAHYRGVAAAREVTVSDAESAEAARRALESMAEWAGKREGAAEVATLAASSLMWAIEGKTKKMITSIHSYVRDLRRKELEARVSAADVAGEMALRVVYTMQEEGLLRRVTKSRTSPTSQTAIMLLLRLLERGLRS